MKKLLLASAAILIASARPYAADLGAAPYTKAHARGRCDQHWTWLLHRAMGGYASEKQSASLDCRADFAGGTVGLPNLGRTGNFCSGIEADAAWSDIAPPWAFRHSSRVSDKIRDPDTVRWPHRLRASTRSVLRHRRLRLG
jgi:hypothetical protein